jgi:hypothetical protein
VQDARGDDLGVVVALRRDVALVDVREERGGVGPEVEAGVVLDLLEAARRDRVAGAVLQEEPVLHELALAVLAASTKR